MHAPDVAVGPAYSPARNTAKALYQSTSDLAKWFWTHYPHERTDPAFYDFYSTWGIGWALADLGVDPYSTEYEGGKNAVFILDHEDFRPGAKGVNEQWYNVDGKWYRATGASYAFSINAEQGVVMGLNRKSPRYAALERSPRVAEEMLPGLSQFSDVAWIGELKVRGCSNDQRADKCRMGDHCQADEYEDQQPTLLSFRRDRQ